MPLIRHCHDCHYYATPHIFHFIAAAYHAAPAPRALSSLLPPLIIFSDIILIRQLMLAITLDAADDIFFHYAAACC
jgi:hypothetical protein